MSRIPYSLSKKEIKDKLGVDYKALRSIFERVGIPYQKGRQILVQTEIQKIFTHWDYD